MTGDCCPPTMTQSTRGRNATLPRISPPRFDRRTLGATAAALLMLTSALAIVWLAAGTSSLSAPGPLAAPLPGVHVAPAAPVAAAAAATPIGPVLTHVHPQATASGRGTFFTNVAIPNPTTGNATCPYTYFCWNNTDNPSANLTTAGYTGMAYTAYTNASPCAGMRGNTTVPDASTEVGWTVSKDFGNTWSAPVYLGNPSCTGTDANYSSAMDPSLTSLANGTFVLAYVEYNYSTQSTYSYDAPPMNYECYAIAYSRVVVSYSYDNGGSWTVPTVINASSNVGCPSPGLPDSRPSVTATGQTIYLSWENETSPFQYYCCGNEYGSVYVVASTDGGSTWSAPVSMHKVVGSYFGTPTSIAMNPALTVDPAGLLFVAYSTNLTYNYICNPTCSYQEVASVYVAVSNNNASSFTFTDISNGRYLAVVSYPAVYTDPAPIIAYSSTSNQLEVAWAGGISGNFCYNEGTYGSYCYSGYTPETIWMANSSTNGSTWSAARDVVPTSMINPNGGYYSWAFNPSFSIDSSGKIHLQYIYLNNSLCDNISPYGYTYSICAPIFQMYQNSTDGGFTWSQPAMVFPNVSYFDGPYHDMYTGTWPGTYSTLLTAGGQVLLLWTTQQCPGYALGTYCNPYQGGGYAEVIASRLFEGTGLTLTFTETGAPTGLNWTADILGNVRVGPTGSSLSISGVPSGAPISFTVPWINVSYGVAYNDTLSVASPSAFTTSSTITVTYDEIVLLNVNSNPKIQSYYFTYGYVNYKMNPAPLSEWLLVNTSVPLSVSTSAFSSPCYTCLNLTFSAWTGTGSGSVNSKAMSITVVPAAQVNETANFIVNSICNIGTYYNGCLNYTYLVTFVEQGLPANTSWGVTVINATTGLPEIFQTTADNVSVPVGPSPVSYFLWSVPSATTGQFWIPSTTAANPIVVPQTLTVNILYALGSASSATFPTQFSEEGLPNGTAWSLEVGGTSYGIVSNSTTLALAGGSAFTANGSFVYLANGTGYYAAAVSVVPYVMNETNASYAVPASISLNGSANVIIDYKPMYYVTVAGSVGGSVTPASQWVNRGASIALNETAAAGYHFVGWSGIGGGSVSSGVAGITVSPTGAVSEFATFRPNSPPTWNLTLTGVGLPAGTPFSVTIGGTTYTGMGSFRIPDLPNGTTTVSAAMLFLNATETTRFVPTGIAATSLSLANGQLDLVANGTLTVSYQTQYTLSVQASSGGSVTPAVGLYWYNSSASVALTAAPAAGHYFGGWNGTGNGSLTTGGASGSATMNAPLTETALFVLRPPAPPATYWLAVSETGLPSALAWNVSLGGFGASGTNASLTVNGLNGSYTLFVPNVYVSTGARWVANLTNVSKTVNANGTFAVSFTEEFLVTVVAGPGGSATPATDWVAAGTQVTLTATANTTSHFLGWNGTGAGAYTGNATSTTLTVNAPITEQATFQPTPTSPGTQGSGTSSSPLMAILLLIVLLVVGAIIGLLVGRRRGASPPPPAPYVAAETPGEGAGEAGADAASGPTWTEEPTEPQ